MIRLESVPGIIIAILTLASVLGAAGSVFRLSLMRASLSTLRDSNTDLTARVVFLEAEDVRNQAKIAVLEHSNEALEKVITGREQLASIETKIDRIERMISASHRPSPS